MANQTARAHKAFARPALLPMCIPLLVLACAVLAPPTDAQTNRVFGLDHLPLGQAVLELQPDRLTVYGSGLSGDGVRTQTPGLPVTWAVALLPPDPASQDTSLEITHTGIIEENLLQTLSVWSIHRLGPQTLITPNLSDIAAGSLVVDYIFDGHSIFREEYPNPVPFTLTASEYPQSFLTELLRFLGMYRTTIGWPTSPAGTTVQTPQGNVFQVHEVRIVAQNIPVSLDGLVHIDMQSANLPFFAILREYTELSACPWCIPGDLNRDGRVGLPDLAVVAANWLQCTDQTDPACTWTAQQSEPGLDRTVSTLLCEAAPLYRLGMSRREFFDDLYPGLDCYGAPDWVHKVADVLWDIFAPPGM